MKNKENVLLGLTCFFGGVVAGFLIAPIKKGLYFGNYSGNHVRSADELKEVIDKNIGENENLK